MRRRRGRFDDGLKGFDFQTRTTDECPIDVWLRQEL